MGSQTEEGRVLDLTSPGCLIESSVAVQKGQSLQLLPGLESPLSILLGVVRWTGRQSIWRQVIKMDESNRLALARLMAQHPPALACPKSADLLDS